MDKTEEMLADLDQLSRTFNLFISKKENLTMIPLELISVKYIGSYGNYPDPGLKEQEEGETVIGKLIPFERNTLLISRIMSITIDLIFEADQLKFQNCDEGDILSSIEIKKSNSLRELLTTIYHLSRNILTESVCSRLIQNGIILDQPLTIRSNLNIVKKNVPKEKPPEPKIIILASPVSPEDPDSEEESAFISPYPIQ